MKSRKLFLIAGFALLVLSACADSGVESDPTYSNPEREKLYKNGSIMSDEGGYDMFGGADDKSKSGGETGIGVNAFLWRASLDTVAFMPIASADPFGGVIITDWYSAPDAPNERIKLNVFIRDRDLRADGVRVSVFRQTKDAGGGWADAPVTASTGSSLENAILTKARQIRMAQKEFK